jgi:CheY-like chemotaxis protein
MPTHPRRKILVVDDSVETARTFALLLQLMGHRAEFVTDPFAALHAARRIQPEIVFLDIEMPGLDGYKVAASLKREFGLQLYIVAITGHGSDQDRRKAREAGFDAHVLKPVDSTIIKSILDTFFELGR